MGKPSDPLDPGDSWAGAEIALPGVTFRAAASPDGTQRRFLRISEQAADLLGIPLERLLEGASILERVDPEHRARCEAEAVASVAERRPMIMEFPLRRADGRTVWLHSTATPRAEGSRDFPGWSVWDGLIVDITARKRSEEELVAHRARLDLAVEATGLGFFDYDIRTGTSVWSDRSKALYGLPLDAELRFDDWFENHIHPDDRPLMEGVYLAALQRPDGIFSLEHRAIAPDGAVRWLLIHGRVLRDEEGPHRVLGTAQDITERRQDQDRLRLLSRELAHRAKNGLSMMTAIVAQSARSAASVSELEAMLVSRIQAMSRAQDLITGDAEPLPLATLVSAAVEPFDDRRILIDRGLGAARLSGTQAFSLTLLLHEFATNATKYGALSNAEGKVTLARDSSTPGRVTLVWREQGGPQVKPPQRQGFGTRLLRIAMKPQGDATVSYAPEGFEARLSFPDLRPQAEA